MQTPRDALLLELARDLPSSPWVPADLFPGKPVPYWAVLSVVRLVELGLVVREDLGRCRWAYRLAAA